VHKPRRIDIIMFLFSRVLMMSLLRFLA